MLRAALVFLLAAYGAALAQEAENALSAAEEDAAPESGAALHRREAEKLRRALSAKGDLIRESGGVYQSGDYPVVMLRGADAVPKERLAEAHLVVAGTPWDNPLMAKALRNLPVRLWQNGRGFSVGRLRVSEGDWQLIARVPSSWNPRKSCYVLMGLMPEAAWWDTDMLYELEVGEWIFRLGYLIAAQGRGGKIEYVSFEPEGWKKIQDEPESGPALVFFGSDAGWMAGQAPQWRKVLDSVEKRLGLAPPESVTVLFHEEAATVFKSTRRWPESAAGEDFFVDAMASAVHAVKRGNASPSAWPLAEMLLRRHWGPPWNAETGHAVALAVAGELEGLPLAAWAARLAGRTDFEAGTLDMVSMAARLEFMRLREGNGFLRETWEEASWKKLEEKMHRLAGEGKLDLEAAWREWVDSEGRRELEASLPPASPCREGLEHGEEYEEAVKSLWGRTKPREEIEPVLRAAVEREHADCEARRHLSELLFRAGRYAEAAEILRPYAD
jgi:hypothetical protein